MPDPRNTEFMDPDMLAFWNRLGPMPGDLRLYGGTALALYLNHRKSTDFDFATPLIIIDEEYVQKIPGFKNAKLNGGGGMVDADVQTAGREIRCTFMELGHLIPNATHAPIEAPNGVAVAHPVDLTAAKIKACITRGLHRDYQDVAECIRSWPNWSRGAVSVLKRNAAVHTVDISRYLADPPHEVVRELSSGDRVTLRQFSSGVIKRQEGWHM